jgi:hypothetical protein
MADLLNIMLIVFAITGGLSFVFLILVSLFYWACSKPYKEE